MRLSCDLCPYTGKSPSIIPAAWLLSATRLAAARGDAAMSAHLSQQLGGAEREPPAWLAHEIARRSRLPRPDDPAARGREGGAFLATSRRPSGAASARPVVLHFYSLACRDGSASSSWLRSISFKIRKAARARGQPGQKQCPVSVPRLNLQRRRSASHSASHGRSCGTEQLQLGPPWAAA